MTITAIQQHDHLSLPVLSEQWREHMLQQDYAASTIKKYLWVIGQFLLWYQEQEQTPLTLHALTPIALISYRNHLQPRHATRSVNLQINALRSWCAWLFEEGYLPNNPAARFRLVDQQGVSEDRREGLNATQVNSLLIAASRSREKERNVAIIQLLLQTGLRLGECATLTLADLSIAERSGMVEVRAGKGNKARSVPLNASARNALAEYLGPRLGVDASLKAVAKKWPQVKDATPLWLSQKGRKKLSASAIGQMISELVEECSARLPAHPSAHTLRHTFARNYLSQYPGDVVGLAALLGHSSLDTTMLYSQPSVRQLAHRVEKLNSNAYI